MRGWLAGAVIVGLALRLAFGLGYWVDKPLTHDEQEYLTLARNVAAGRGLVYDPAAQGGADLERFGRAPLYPVFLAVVGGGASPAPGSTPAPVKIAQAVVGAAGVLLVGLLASRVAGGRVGRIAALVAAVYPPLVWICAYALSEALYSTLALAGGLVLAHVDVESGSKPTRRRPGPGTAAAAAGLLIGLAAITRPAMLLFLAIAAAWLVSRRRAALAVALALGAMVIITPWTVRNAQRYGRFVLIASEGGITFWTGNHPLARGDGDMAANPDIKRANLELRAKHPGLTSEELEPVYYREAIAHIVDRPVWWAGLMARKFVHTWLPIGPSYTLHSRRYFAASVVSYGLVLPFAVAGAVRLIRRRADAAVLWLLGGSVVVANLLFFPQERFRIPVLDPVLIICAAVWIGGRLSPAPTGSRTAGSAR